METEKKIVETFDQWGISNLESYIESAKDDNEKVMRRIIRHPLYFVEHFLGVNKKNKLTISNQQRELLSLIGAMCYAKKALWDAKTPKQQEKLRKATIDLSKKIGISVRSGRGAGKTSCTAWILIWFLLSHHNSKICCVGPTQDSLQKVLFSEIHNWVHKKNDRDEYLFQEPFRSMLEVRIDTISVIEDGKESRSWQAYTRVSSRASDKGQTEGVLGGFHGDSILAIFDEANAVNDNAFGALEQTLVGRCNLALLLFNPTKNYGYAWKSHFDPNASRYFAQLHWNTEKSDLVSKDFIKTLRDKYGENSNEYKVSVLGIPPDSDDSALIPYIWVEEAVEKPITQYNKPMKLLGVDVGGGQDPTVCCFREGLIVHDFHRIHSIDMVEQALEVRKLVQKYNIEMVLIDTIGIGSGLYNLLRSEKGFVTRGVNVATKASSPDYRILRDELWFLIRSYFETKAVSIPKNDAFRVEITTIKYDTLGGKIVVEGKESIRKRLGRSCDTADSFLLTMTVKDWNKSGTLDLISTREEEDYDDKANSLFNSGKTWMSI